jgi:hypothetical protein
MWRWNRREGVYWIPVWNVLEESRYRFELLLVNPAQVRAQVI